MESLFATSCLVPETPTLEWSFGETTISQGKVWNHPTDKRTRWIVVDALLSFFLPKKNPPGWLLEVLDIGPDVQIWACLHLSRQAWRKSWGAKELLGIQALLGGENGSDPKQS